MVNIYIKERGGIFTRGEKILLDGKWPRTGYYASATVPHPDRRWYAFWKKAIVGRELTVTPDGHAYVQDFLGEPTPHVPVTHPRELRPGERINFRRASGRVI